MSALSELPRQRFSVVSVKWAFDFSKWYLVLQWLLTVNINAIALPRNQGGNTFAGIPGTLTGFGRFSQDDYDMSNEQRFATMTILTNTQCAVTIFPHDSEICTDSTAGSFACGGDAGGGLFVGDAFNPAGRLLVGLKSTDYYCSTDSPGMYTRVTSFIAWIDATVAAN